MATAIREAREKVKIVLLGELGAGKTSLFLRFAEDTFLEKHIQSVEEPVKIREFPIEDTRLKIEVWDTAGDEAFRAITTSYLRGVNGVALVLDLSQSDSIPCLEKWNYECDSAVRPGTVKILIGTKSDLPGGFPRADAETWASERNMRFFVTSSKLGEGVMEPFIFMGREVLKAESPTTPTGRSPSKTLHLVTPKPKEKDKAKEKGCAIL